MAQKWENILSLRNLLISGIRKMENGVSSNLRSPGGAVRNSSGIFYVLKDLSSYTLSMPWPPFTNE